MAKSRRTGRTRPTFSVNTVPREFIIEAWERQCALAEEPIRALMGQVMTEQPAVGIYLTVCDERLGDESERNQLIPLSALSGEAHLRIKDRTQLIMLLHFVRRTIAKLTMVKRQLRWRMK